MENNGNGKGDWWFSCKGWQVSPFLGKWKGVATQKKRKRALPKGQNKEFYETRVREIKLNYEPNKDRYSITCYVFGNRGCFFRKKGNVKELGEAECARVNNCVDRMYKALRIPKDNKDDSIVDYIKTEDPKLWDGLIKKYKRNE